MLRSLLGGDDINILIRYLKYLLRVFSSLHASLFCAYQVRFGVFGGTALCRAGALGTSLGRRGWMRVKCLMRPVVQWPQACMLQRQKRPISIVKLASVARSMSAWCYQICSERLARPCSVSLRGFVNTPAGKSPMHPLPLPHAGCSPAAGSAAWRRRPAGAGRLSGYRGRAGGWAFAWR